MSCAYDIHALVQGLVALKLQDIDSDTTTVGEIIDTLDWEAIEFMIMSGTLTDGAFAVQLFEGDEDDMADEAQVADAMDIIGSIPSFALTEDDTIKSFGYVGNKRYLRIKVVSTATTDGGFFAAMAVQGKPRHTT